MVSIKLDVFFIVIKIIVVFFFFINDIIIFMSTKEKINIIDFNIYDDLGISELSPEEQEDFKENIFGIIVRNIIKKTTRNFNKEDIKKVTEMVKEAEDLEKIFEFIAEKNPKFTEEAAEVNLNTRKAIYKLINNK